MQENTKDRFLEAECRDGVWVSAELKAAWKCMLDMLEVFIEICNRHHLCYWLEGGSMLGAVRHKGFIPWDDDIDIAMPRNDFEKLQKILPSELPAHLFMQTSETDPEYMAPLMKIRDSRTTGIDAHHARCGLRFNMGIFIDINPIDSWVSSKWSRKIRFRLANFWRGIRRNRYENRGDTLGNRLRRAASRAIFALLGNSRIYRLRELPFVNLAKRPSSGYAIIPAHYGWGPKTYIDAKWINSFIEVPFEYLTVRIPVGYEARLETMYGDWRTPVKGGAFHGSIMFNTEKDYKHTLQELFGYESDS